MKNCVGGHWAVCCGHDQHSSHMLWAWRAEEGERTCKRNETHGREATKICSRIHIDTRVDDTTCLPSANSWTNTLNSLRLPSEMKQKQNKKIIESPKDININLVLRWWSRHTALEAIYSIISRSFPSHCTWTNLALLLLPSASPPPPLVRTNVFNK